jgi:hypothetical protein
VAKPLLHFGDVGLVIERVGGGRRHARRRLLRTGKRWWVRLHEKGGKRHEIPCHHNLEAYLDAYLQAARILDAKKSPLFRSARGRTDELTELAMHRVDVWRMIRRRAKDCRHRCRDVLPYLPCDGDHRLSRQWRHFGECSAHESPRTTKLYDRTGDEITLDEVERIAI